jgi:lipopolysaccharide transport system ATP-binding protein
MAPTRLARLLERFSLRRRVGMLPGLIIPGAMKAGTTSLFAHLAGHPQLVPAAGKETHYFDWHTRRGPAWYARQFRRRPGLLAFEATPYYMFEPRVPRLVRELVPDVKLMFLLRDPVDRAFSHYHNNRRLGREPLSFESALGAEDERLAGEEERMLSDPDYLSEPHRLYSYRRRGLYAEQIDRWLRHFPARQMLFVDSRRLFCDPGSVVADVLEFLGLDPWRPAGLRARNEGRHDETISAATRDHLRRQFETPEHRLATLIGWCPSATGG